MPQKEHSEAFKVLYLIALAWQLGFLIVVPLVLFGLLGSWLDKKLGTSGVLTGVFLFLGLIATFFDLYHIFETLKPKR